MRPLVVVPEELDGIFDTDDMYVCSLVRVQQQQYPGSLGSWPIFLPILRDRRPRLCTVG